MIETICPHCGNKKIFEDSFAGRTFRCPNCKEPVTIQSVADAVAAESDSHEISFDTQLKKAEYEKKLTDLKNAYYAASENRRDKIIRSWILIGIAIFFFIVWTDNLIRDYERGDWWIYILMVAISVGIPLVKFIQAQQTLKALSQRLASIEKQLKEVEGEKKQDD